MAESRISQDPTTTSRSVQWHRVIIRHGFLISPKDAAQWANKLRHGLASNSSSGLGNKEAPFPGTSSKPTQLKVLEADNKSHVFLVMAAVDDEVKVKHGYRFSICGDSIENAYSRYLLCVHETEDYLKIGENGALVLEEKHKSIPDSVKKPGEKLLEEVEIEEYEFTVVVNDYYNMRKH